MNAGDSRARQFAATLLRCMDMKDTAAADAVWAKILRAPDGRRLADQVAAQVWQVEAHRAWQASAARYRVQAREPLDGLIVTLARLLGEPEPRGVSLLPLPGPGTCMTTGMPRAA